MLVEVLRRHIAGSRPGEILPSTRLLVARHRVSPVTVSRALAQLTAEGLVVTRPGVGSFVAARPRPKPADMPDTAWQSVPLGDRAIDTSRLATVLRPTPDGTMSLDNGYPHPSSMPIRALAAAVGRVSRRPDIWERPPSAGLARLRSWFARSLGAAVDAADVLITGGGQSAISATFRSILPPGAPLLVESPTYSGALGLARAAGLRPVPVPIDRDGLQIEQLRAAFEATGARALYCQPTFHNPTGSVLAAERRSALLAAAADAGAFVIEDGFARWLAHEHPAPAPLLADDRDGRVVHISSLTKVTSANLRVAAIVARGPVAERLRSLRIVDDFFVSRLLQEVALELVESPAWPRHLTALSAGLSLRRDTLAAALAARLPELRVSNLPAGGTHLWTRLPEGLDDLEVADAAERAGVLVGPGRPFFPAEPPASHLRLSFTGVAHAEELGTAVVAARRGPRPARLSGPPAAIPVSALGVPRCRGSSSSWPRSTRSTETVDPPIVSTGLRNSAECDRRERLPVGLAGVGAVVPFRTPIA